MTLANPSRRNLFRRVSGKPNADPRPPWAVLNFHDQCNRCEACIEACDEKLIVRGDGGFPTVDFERGGCTFCAACVQVCEPRALKRHDGPAWGLKAVISDNCLSARGIVCRSCGDICDQRAIQFQILTGGRAMVRIHAELCNGCGFCQGVCPDKAIQMKGDL